MVNLITFFNLTVHIVTYFLVAAVVSSSLPYTLGNRTNYLQIQFNGVGNCAKWNVSKQIATAQQIFFIVLFFFRKLHLQ